MTIECIVNNGANGEPEVPLWHCPCPECTKLEWEATFSDVEPSERPTLAAFRREVWPTHYQ